MTYHFCTEWCAKYGHNTMTYPSTWGGWYPPPETVKIGRWLCPDCDGWVLDTVQVHYCIKLPKPTPKWNDRIASCPCQPDNGGSGVCGCILNNPVTC